MHMVHNTKLLLQENYSLHHTHYSLLHFVLFYCCRFWLSSVQVVPWMPSCWVSPSFMKEVIAKFWSLFFYLFHLQMPALFIPSRILLCGTFFPLPSWRASSICVITVAQISRSGQCTSNLCHFSHLNLKDLSIFFYFSTKANYTN